MKYFIATMKVIVETDNSDEAAGIFSAILTDNSTIFDWAYLLGKKQELRSFPYQVFPVLAEYEEGDLDNILSPAIVDAFLAKMALYED